MRTVYVAAIAVLIAGCAGQLGSRQMAGASSVVVAQVNGWSITMDAYREYEATFRADDGQLTQSSEIVLQSLINQLLAHFEAERRGIVVDQAEVDAAATQIEALGFEGIRNRSGDRAALRRRLHTFLEFKAVRSAVLRQLPEVSEFDILLAYRHKFPDSGTPQGEAATRIRNELIAERQEQAWSDWLRQQRECATIAIIDESMSLMSSTPKPGCTAQ